VGELFHLQFTCDVGSFFETHGEIPLPPYIGRKAEKADRERYQTVFCARLGRHRRADRGAAFDARYFFARSSAGRPATCSSRCTRRPAHSSRCAEDDIAGHRMHEEYLEVPEAACDAINGARAPADA